MTTGNKLHEHNSKTSAALYLNPFILQYFLFSIKILERNPKMALNKLKVCLIGAGPSGMSVMYHLNKLAVAGKQIPQIKCYEKQSACGGLWNYSWRTGKFFVFP